MQKYKDTKIQTNKHTKTQRYKDTMDITAYVGSLVTILVLHAMIIIDY